jgi:LPXTG-site transpeptidase (sortase) family protein
MRLRFGKPSLFIIIFLGLIAGVAFVVLNSSDPATDPNTVQAPATVSEGASETGGEVAQQPTAVSDVPDVAPVDGVAQQQPDTVADASSPDNSRANLPEIPVDTEIFIPTAGVNSQVVQAYLSGNSWDVSQIRANVGHLQGTSWLGQNGNIVLSGHVERADGSAGVFANLDLVEVDDPIQLMVNGERRVFIVTEIRTTTPDDLSPIMPTRSERLTLITCGAYDFFQDAYLERLIIVAEPA